MRSRKSFWILLSLLCLAGAWLFWHQDNRRAVTKKNFASQPIQTVRSASTAPKFLTMVSTKAAKARVASASTNPFAHRLSNTSRSIGELMRDDKAILLENALIDLRNPLNFSIPKNLQAQGDPGAYIVQANGPINNAFRAMLAAAGATIVSYIPNDAYLVRAPASVANQFTAAGYSVIPYEPYYKVQSSLLAFDQTSLPDGAALNIGLFADNAQATIQQIEKLGGQVFAEDSSPFGKIVRVIPPQNWTALATLPGVQLVEPFRKRVLANDLARVTLGVATNTITTTNYMNLTGKNVIVEMNDSGVDATHPDLTGRVIGDVASSLVDTNGHGTHVAGIIMGDGTQSATVTNAQGSINPGVTGQYRGKAQAATLFSIGFLEGQDANVANSFQVSDSYLQEQPALTNALISNNSWGFDGDNTYDLEAASYDAAVRDALPGVTGSQPVLFVFAAGNDGAGDDNGGSGVADSITSPGTAKNVITVGATEQLRNITNSVTNFDGSVTTPWQPMTDTSSQVAGYSSRGNVGVGIEGTAGRFKPDVVAPGTFVISTRSAQWDTNAYFSPTNITEGELSDVVDSGSANFYSVSIPSNALQLIIQVVRNGQSPDPLPAMPIPVWNGTDPRVALPYVTETNTVIIPTNALALNPVGTVWQYAVSNSTSDVVNYDLIVEVVTTNDTGDFFDVLHALDDTLGTGPPFYYRYESGTSMAAPAVSGVLALMQDFFTNQWSMRPSPALMKAMVINGARQTANYSFQVQNSINFQGWGMVNLPDALPIGITTNFSAVCSSFIQDQNPNNALATGDSQTFFVTVNTNTQAEFQPLRVTLAWTDPPGNPAAAIKLVNNLDLVVSNMDTGTTVYYGNDISSGVFNTPESPSSPPNLDSINNVENVYIPPLLSGHYAVIVSGNRVNVNAVTAQTNNSAGFFAPNVVQDYALVISSGDGGSVTNALTVTANPIVSNPNDQLITDVTNTSTALLNQFVGANTPLLGTNALLFTNAVIVSGETNEQITIGMTNQWHFYVVTNSINNSPDFTNAAIITFNPPTLSIPREGVFADSVANATRPEADIDLYVATDPRLTNLNSTVISQCVTNNAQNSEIGASVAGAFYGASLSRGGTEFVVDTNSTPGEVYYVGVKSEDQEASEYDLLPVFTQTPFSVMQPNGAEMVNGVPLPINIPDGSPALPGVAYIIGLALYPIEVGSVTANVQIWHQNFGDLIGPLAHNDISVVLNNHDSLGNTIGDPPFVYDDSGANDIAGSKPSDGPGSLNNFIGTQGLGPWTLTEADDSLTQTGSVQQFSLLIQPHGTTDDSHTNTVAGMSLFTDFVDVPPGATNLTITVTNLTGTANPPLKLFVKFGSLPATNNPDETVLITTGTIIPPALQGSISVPPPLTAGRYFYSVYNPSPTLQQFIVNATLGLGAAPAQVDFSSSGPATILDDAVMTNSIFVTQNGIISSMDVGIVVQDPRISDLVFHLISPDGTRVLLMENRGGTSTSGAGGAAVTTNITFTSQNIEVLPARDDTAGPIGYGWTVTTNQVSVVNDPANTYQSGNFVALANGTISTTLPTIAGQTSTLTFAYRGPGIAGFWRGENNFNDSIYGIPGSGQNITFAPGKVGTAFVSTYTASPPQSQISVPDQTNYYLTNSLSIDGWIKSAGITGSGTSGQILWRGDCRAGFDPYFFELNGDNTLGFGICDATGAGLTLNTSVPLAINQWYHVAATLDGNTGTMSIYTNGVLAAQTTTAMRPFGALIPSQQPSIGIGNTGTACWAYIPFNGDLDEISLYSRAMSASEIKAIYNAGSAGKFDPASTFPQNLAKAEVSIGGGTPVPFFGGNTNWQTTNITFTATNNQTPLQITGLEPGMLLGAMSLTTTQIVNQFQYLTFTENTNLTTTPIKFAPTPFVSGASSPATISDFETAAAGDYTNAVNDETTWSVLSNQVSVVNNQANAQAGNQFLALANGMILNTLPTVAGETYTLTFADRGPGIVSWWRGEGSANDSAGANNGTLNGGTAFAAGKVGQAFSFDGTSGYVSIPNSPSLNPAGAFSIEGWIFPTRDANQVILSKWGDQLPTYANNRSYQFETIAGLGLSFPISDLANQNNGAFQAFSVSGVLTLNAWNHVAATYDSATGIRCIYVNGVKVASHANAPVAVYDSIIPATIGIWMRSSTFNQDFFQGSIDELSLYNRALSDSEIKAIFTNGTAGKFDASAAIPQNLAEATVAITGVGSSVLYGNNTSWQTQNTTFTATQNGTPLIISGLEPGMLLDSFTLTQSAGDLFYLPEQSLDAFTGENAFGDWLLEIQDDRAGAGLTNTLESWQLRFNFTTATSLLTNGAPVTNSIQANSIEYYLVNVPTNADFATNLLFTTSGPLNFWFNETTPPSGTNSPGDYLLFNTSANDSNVLSTVSAPTNIVPGGSYYLAVQNTNSFAITNYAVEVNFHLLTVTNLTAGQPQTNTVAPDSFAYYAVTVPTNADVATNMLLFATGPVNLLFNQTTLPTGLGAGDFTLLSASTAGSTNLTLAGSPPLVPGATYYLGVQNTNAVAVNFGIEVNFHLLVYTNPTIVITSITHTNIGGTNGFWLTWFAPSNDLFQVQWTGNLAPPQVWNTFTNIVGYNTNVFTSPTNTQFNFFDDGSQFPFGPLRFYRLILLGSGLTNGVSQTNSIPPGSITYYSISVPTNADFSTNSLFMTNGPLNLLFNQAVPPTGTNAGDYLLFSASANASAILGTNSPPPFFVPGGTYYLGVQNTNSFAVNYSIQVDFHLFTPTSPPTNPLVISSITYTNVGGTNAVLLRWTAPANYQFQIQWVTNLDAPIAWNTISNVVITSTTTNYSYLDDGSLDGGFGPLKFYRLIEYPYSTPIPMALSIANAQYTTNGIQFQWSAPTNYQYEIEWTTNLELAQSNWLILTNPVLSVTNTVFTFTDTNQTGPSTSTKFFRLIAAP
jgi:subtilisin-like proprotein convertase family protein